MTSERYRFFKSLFERHADAPCIILESGETISYAAFFDRSIRILNYLVAKGLRHGDRIVVELENRPEYLELFLAAALGGMVICPADPAMALTQLNKLKHVVDAKLAITLASQLAHSVDNSVPESVEQGGLDEPFLIVFSSGTTGPPKGIVQSLRNFFQSAKAFGDALGLKPGEVTLHNWPMFYMAGLFNLFAVPIVHGGAIAITKRFAAKDIGDFWGAVTRFKPDYVYLSPTMAASLTKTFKFFKYDKAVLANTRVISTSSVLYPSIKEDFWKVFGVEIMPCFGITELGGSLTIGHGRSAPFSVGRAIDGVEVTVDQDEILVKTPFIAMGYLNESGHIDEFDRVEPYRSGDLGRIENGEIFILGRKRDSIKKAGEFINLTEIEDMINGSGLCEESLAVGRPDVFWGEVYDVFFVPRQGDNPLQTKDALSRLLNQYLPQNQRPASVRLITEIPRNSLGKPMKSLIRYEEIENAHS